MSVSEITSLVIMLYEYLYNKGNRIEAAYLQELDNHYKHMFNARPERYISSPELLDLIESKARFDQFVEIQKDIYEILSLYKKSAFGDSAHE